MPEKAMLRLALIAPSARDMGTTCNQSRRFLRFWMTHAASAPIAAPPLQPMGADIGRQDILVFRGRRRWRAR